MIYLDNSATTAMYCEIIDIIKKYSCENYYNPSALHAKSASIKQDILMAKAKTLQLLGGTGGTLVMTASGTESDNMSIFGCRKFKGGKILISAVEHSAIYYSAKKLESLGYELQIIPCDQYGSIDIKAFKSMLSKDVMLVSIMHVCNETGAVNDLELISKLIKEHSKRAVFHSDGVQAVGKLPINLVKLGVDLYSISAHKFHGMKGSGALYIRAGLNLSPMIFGGGQEGGVRSATENLSAIISMPYALQRSLNELDIQSNISIISYIREQLLLINSDFIINTHLTHSASHILSFSIPDTKGEILLHMLEDDGIIIGTGSACSASASSSRIPLALGLDNRYHSGMMRISINSLTTIKQARIFLNLFAKNYSQLTHNMSKKI